MQLRSKLPVHPYLLLVPAAALALCLPLFAGQWFESHERDSYVVRTVEWAAGLQRGELYPRWCPDFYGGYGSPFFLFYAPLVYAAAGTLAAFVTGPIAALKVVIAAVSVVAGLGTYALVYGETRRHEAALVGALAYLASPYRIADLYERGDIAEYTALALLPLALALYRAAALSLTPRRAAARAGAAAVCHALLIMSHTLLGMWGTGLLALVVVVTGVQLYRRRARRRVSLLAGAFVAALALSAAYTVPAFAYRHFVRVDALVGGYYEPSDQWLRLGALMDKGMFHVGPLLIVAAALVALALLRDRRGALGALGWLALALAFTALTLPVASGLWAQRELSLLRLIQFPWRLLGPATLCAAVAAGLAFGRVMVPGRAWRGAVAPALSVALLVLLAWPAAHRQPRGGAIAQDPESIRASIVSTTGVDEYLPRAAPAVPPRPASGLVQAVRDARLEAHQSAGDAHALAVEATGPAAAVTLALHAFPGWRLVTRSGPAPAVLAAAGGLLEARLAAAGRYELDLSYRATPLVRGAQLASLLVLFLMGPALRRLVRA